MNNPVKKRHGSTSPLLPTPSGRPKKQHEGSMNSYRYNRFTTNLLFADLKFTQPACRLVSKIQAAKNITANRAVERQLLAAISPGEISLRQTFDQPLRRKADVPLRSLRADDSGNSARSSYCLDPFRVAINAQVTDRIAPRGFRLLG